MKDLESHDSDMLTATGELGLRDKHLLYLICIPPDNIIEWHPLV